MEEEIGKSSDMNPRMKMNPKRQLMIPIHPPCASLSPFSVVCLSLPVCLSCCACVAAVISLLPVYWTPCCDGFADVYGTRGKKRQILCQTAIPSSGSTRPERKEVTSTQSEEDARANARVHVSVSVWVRMRVVSRCVCVCVCVFARPVCVCSCSCSCLFVVQFVSMCVCLSLVWFDKLSALCLCVFVFSFRHPFRHLSCVFTYNRSCFFWLATRRAVQQAEATWNERRIKTHGERKERTKKEHIGQKNDGKTNKQNRKQRKTHTQEKTMTFEHALTLRESTFQHMKLPYISIRFPVFCLHRLTVHFSPSMNVICTITTIIITTQSIPANGSNSNT